MIRALFCAGFAGLSLAVFLTASQAQEPKLVAPTTAMVEPAPKKQTGKTAVVVNPKIIGAIGGSVALAAVRRLSTEPDLANPDIGLDPELLDLVERVTDVTVPSVVDPNKPKGVADPKVDKDVPLLPLKGIDGPDGLGGLTGISGGGGGASLALPGFAGRFGATKEKLLKDGGGNAETEAAVARSLQWLSKQQNVAGGFWEFDGSAKGDRIAATGMCLLPFLAAGETHKSAKKYKATVQKGLDYLKAQMKPNGLLNANMYSQAIATMALCEAAGMTRDDQVKKAARIAVDYIVAAQANDGSWGYTTGAQGDTSIVGWQLQALRSAKLAEISVPKKTFEQAEKFLESVTDDGATYGYRTKSATGSLTAVGLLCRQFLGWTPRNQAAGQGRQLVMGKVSAGGKRVERLLLLLRNPNGAFLRRASLAARLEPEGARHAVEKTDHRQDAER